VVAWLLDERMARSIAALLYLRPLKNSPLIFEAETSVETWFLFSGSLSFWS
jgi:hypothetical protein